MTGKAITKRIFVAVAVLCMALATAANASVSLNALFSSHMILQRDKPVPVWGTASPSEAVTVKFAGQEVSTVANAQGNWQVTLTPMSVNATAQTMTVTGTNNISITDVLIGDVWICSGQSNMAFGLSGCNRPTDISSANFPGLRTFWVPLVTSRDPSTSLTGSWTVCSPGTASGFSAVAFYYGRKIYQETGVPTGLVVSSVGGTRIDPWLAPDGLTDVPVIQPLFSQEILPWGPFSLFNGMVYPLSPYAAKGMIWYQGENSETTVQSTDSYYLKMKALSQGWKRMLGLDDFAFYFVQIANWGTQPTDATPVLSSGGWDADTRLQQANAMALPHSGMASAIDIGDSADMHPTDKLDLGERLALWALKNDYGQPIAVTSGPILKDVSVVGSTVVCSFDYVGSGLMVGSKTPYMPTTEVVGGTLAKFSIAGSNAVWYAATATISGDTVILSSPSVTTPKKVAYACWQNPIGLNLYNREGLPASPFYVDDVAAKYTITASAGANGTISPLGAATYLKRKTAFYTITPDANYYIQDVKVDGVSVGAVKTYTFDPLYANHTIAATFAATAPNFTVTTSSNSSGTITPSGTVSVVQGASQAFKITPNANCRLLSVTLDGAPVGRRNGVVFADVRTNHTLSAFFGIIPTPDAGTGLRGDYYAGMNFDTFRLSRTDANVNFDWGYGSPNAVIPTDGFSVRWTGLIEPQFTETYKFYLNHDDGARLWINNQLIIDKWTGAGTDDAGTINLTAGQQVAIKLEYYDNLNGASCKLEWSSPSLPREFVPQSQLFPSTTPIYTLTTSAGANGTISPSGTVLANSGGSQTFSILPSTGYNIADVKVDNNSVGAVSSYTFSNITANHSISATFSALPSYAVSGKVTSKSAGTGISGAKVNFYTSANATGNASYTATTDSSGNYSIAIPVGTWYVCSLAANYFTSQPQTLNVISAPASNINFALADGTRNIPRTADLLFSAITDTFPASGNTGNWASYLPAGQTYTALGSPTVETIMGRKWEKNVYADNDAYRVGTYSSAIAVNGVTIVAAVKPTYFSVGGEPRGEIVDIFYNELFMAVSHGTGEVIIDNKGYTQTYTGYKIPDGQTTILSLVVQANGNMVLYANGVQKWSKATGSTYSTLTPSGFNAINIGRNEPDGWSTFSGYIGDVFCYKVALSDADRTQLEGDLTSKFISGGVTTYTITATTGLGGSISPNGTTVVNSGSNQTCTITPDAGYAISDVTVDGVSKGAITSFTFSNVTASHTISATFIPAASTIAMVKAQPAGTLLKLTGTEIVVYAPRSSGNVRTTNYFYVGEKQAQGSLKVVDKTSDTLTLGNVASNLIGYVRKPADKEMYLELTGTPTGSGYTPIRPIGIGNKTILTDAKVLTNAVKVWGKVRSVNGATSFVISDGYDATGVTVMVNGVLLPSPFDTTKTAVVTGIISQDGTSTPMIYAQSIAAF